MVVRQSDGLRLSLATQRLAQQRAIHELAVSDVVLICDGPGLGRINNSKALLTPYSQACARIKLVHALVLLTTFMNLNAALLSDHSLV